MSAPWRRSHVLVAFLTLLAASAPRAGLAGPTWPGPPMAIQRAAGSITIDGDLSDEGWKGITPITTWFETRVGDNVEPQVKNVGYLAYDDRYLYAAFRFDDPDPKQIRAPIGDHDQLNGSTDYGGIIVASNDDGKSAIEFLANASGLMYDAVNDDATGEDSSPDFYWEAAGKITSTGWNLEIRVPFSSLRYSRERAPAWGILLYRNYPRDRHYQFFTARLPREASCFICNSSRLTGLTDLPQSSHLVMVPYASSQRIDAPRPVLGSPLADGQIDSRFGMDVKWSPLASTAVDATVLPDFSQVEGDVAQIGANERFALSYPEKRPFFIEGINLFSTPFQAVYTRTITAPNGGVRATGHAGGTAFTALVAHDQGQGTVILPGPEGSGSAVQDFGSDVGVLRLRHDLGPSFVSLLATGREIRGGGHNAVLGPDFQWRPRPTDAVTGQALWSDSRTPDRRDLASEWNGRSLRDRAYLLRGTHNTRALDVFLQGQDLGPSFRADEGFIPQVGYREGYFESGYTVRPKSFFSRIRMFTIDWYDQEHSGATLSRRVSVGAGADGRWNSFVRIELDRDDLKVGDRLFTRFRPYVNVQAVPGRVLNNLSLEAYLFDEVDFDNARKGKGTTLLGTATVCPSDHLELVANASTRWLHVNDPSLGAGRLFLAQVERLKATWSINSRAFLRLIGQYVQTSRDTSLYLLPAPPDTRPSPKDATFNFSSLVAYKLNWQTVLYLGYGDDRDYLITTRRLERSGRQAFAKVSYAVQR
jgi:hypothetical protein